MSTPPADLPQTREYLASLPAGLESYPEATVKGSLMRELVNRPPPPMKIDAVPEDLRPLFDDPPLVSEWVPEVRLVALCMTTLEIAYEGEQAPYCDFIQKAMHDVMGSPLYRVLFALLSPHRLAKGSQKRWDALRRGTTRQLLERNENGNVGVIGYPPNLFNRFYIANTLAGLLGIYQLSRAPDPVGRILEWTPTSATLEIIYDQSKPRGRKL